MSVFPDRSLLEKINRVTLFQQMKVKLTNEEYFQLLLLLSDRYSLDVPVIPNPM